MTSREAFEEYLSFLIKRDGFNWSNPSSFLLLLALNVDLMAGATAAPCDHEGRESITEISA